MPYRFIPKTIDELLDVEVNKFGSTFNLLQKEAIKQSFKKWLHQQLPEKCHTCKQFNKCDKQITIYKLILRIK